MDGWNTIFDDLLGYVGVSLYFHVSFAVSGRVVFFLDLPNLCFFASNKPQIPRYRNHQYDMDCITWSPAGRILQAVSYGCHMSYLARDNINYQKWKKTYISNIKTKDTYKITPGKCDKSLRPSWSYICIARWWFVMGWVSGLLDIGWATCDSNPHVSCFSTGRICHGGCEARHTCFGTLWSTWLFTFFLQVFVQKTNSHHCGKSWWPNQDVIPSLKLTWHSTWQ